LSEQALSLTLNQTKPEGNQQPCEVSIATIADELEGKDFQIEDDLIRVRVTTPVGSFELRGLSFHLKVAVVILELQKEGIKPFASQWFWYDTDESDTSPTTRYSFFVIHKDKIVREEISFLDYSGSGFDPAAFDSGDDSDDDSPWQLAQAAYWYRQFYQEMKLGQLMVLRPDTPVLHYYPEGRPWLKLAGEPISSVALLGSIRTLLRLAIVLLALIAFLLIRR
jgi:hypothetical protein